MMGRNSSVSAGNSSPNDSFWKYGSSGFRNRTLSFASTRATPTSSHKRLNAGKYEDFVSSSTLTTFRTRAPRSCSWIAFRFAALSVQNSSSARGPGWCPSFSAVSGSVFNTPLI